MSTSSTGLASSSQVSSEGAPKPPAGDALGEAPLPFECSIVDFENQKAVAGIIHSGDKVDDNARQGRQTMAVDLTGLPQAAQFLFFTLSSFKSDDLRAFSDPSLTLRNAKTQEVLAKYDASSKAAHTQALILCVAQRDKDTGGWSVRGIGEPSDGNSMDYEPIQSMCEDVVRELDTALDAIVEGDEDEW